MHRALHVVPRRTPTSAVKERIVRALRDLARRLPPRSRSAIKTLAYSSPANAARRVVRPVRWGNLRNHLPVDGSGGSGRGTAIDQYYVSSFLEQVAADLKGRVLVFRDSTVVARHAERSAVIEVIDVEPRNDQVTVLADPGSPGAIKPSSTDCIVLVDGLRWVADVEATLRTVWQGVAAGGVLLVAIPTLSPVTDDALGLDRWRLTPAGLAEVLRRACPDAEAEIMTFGNPVAAVALVAGLAAEDLDRAELGASDPRFAVVAAARVRKPEVR